jgi:hypothetical protein
MDAFAANDAFKKAEASGRHFRTKIAMLKDRLEVVQPAHLAESKRYSATRFTMTTSPQYLGPGAR